MGQFALVVGTLLCFLVVRANGHKFSKKSEPEHIPYSSDGDHSYDYGERKQQSGGDHSYDYGEKNQQSGGDHSYDYGEKNQPSGGDHSYDYGEENRKSANDKSPNNQSPNDQSPKNANDGSGVDIGGYEGPRTDSSYQDDQDFGCSCILYVERTEVFRRRPLGQQWFGCDFHGLEICSQYCAVLFEDEGLNAQSRADACDVLNRPVHTSWYRRSQVCGMKEFKCDNILPTALCCRRGRPSLDCFSTTHNTTSP